MRPGTLHLNHHFCQALRGRLVIDLLDILVRGLRPKGFSGADGNVCDWEKEIVLALKKE